MNPLTNVKNITKLNDTELERGLTNKSSSWHDMYKDSAWIFIGGLSYGMTEGDVITVFSQYGEIVNINMVRDKKTGKIQGFCFLCYANQKSTILAVDNLNGIKLCGRTIRVDHVADYRIPKEHEDDDEITKMLAAQGCLPMPVKPEHLDDEVKPTIKTEVKVKKEKKNRRKKKKHKRYSSDSDSSSSEENDDIKATNIKKEKHDPGYDKHDNHKHPGDIAEEYTYNRKKDTSRKRHESSDSSNGKLDTQKKTKLKHKRHSSDSDNSPRRKRESYDHLRRDETQQKDIGSSYGLYSKAIESSKKHKKSKELLPWLKKKSIVSEDAEKSKYKDGEGRRDQSSDRNYHLNHSKSLTSHRDSDGKKMFENSNYILNKGKDERREYKHDREKSDFIQKAQVERHYRSNL